MLYNKGKDVNEVNTMLPENQIETIKDVLVPELSPYFITVFGSAAASRERNLSDIDLAFLSGKEFDDYEVFMLAQKIADIAGRDVDLIQLQKASTVFQAEIVSTGEMIYCENQARKEQFEMLAYKKYAKLNEERQPILDQIKESGTIYGKWCCFETDSWIFMNMNP